MVGLKSKIHNPWLPNIAARCASCPTRTSYTHIHQLCTVNMILQLKRYNTMTTISYKRRGGTLGQEITANFDLNSMPASDSQHLQDLIDESNFFEIPIVDAVPSSPDEFEYIITVISENSIHTVSATDNLMPRSLRSLIQDLTELAIPTRH